VEHFIDVDSTPDNDNVAIQDAPNVDDSPIVDDPSIGEHSSPVVQPPQHSIANDRPRRGPKPRKRLTEECNVAYALSVAEDIEGVEPSNYSEAIISANGNNWMAAMHDEMESLEKNGTWDLVQLPKGKKTVRCKWIFKRKEEMYKARLVLKAIARFQVLILMMSFPGC
jgi:hypothetical protein